MRGRSTVKGRSSSSQLPNYPTGDKMKESRVKAVHIAKNCIRHATPEEVKKIAFEMVKEYMYACFLLKKKPSPDIIKKGLEITNKRQYNVVSKNE